MFLRFKEWVVFCGAVQYHKEVNLDDDYQFWAPRKNSQTSKENKEEGGGTN